MPFEKDPNEIGCLWAKSGAKGDYLTGVIDGVNVVCFAIKSNNPKAPSWRVLKSVPRDEKPMSRAAKAAQHDPQSSGEDDLGGW